MAFDEWDRFSVIEIDGYRFLAETAPAVFRLVASLVLAGAVR